MRHETKMMLGRMRKAKNAPLCATRPGVATKLPWPGSPWPAGTLSVTRLPKTKRPPSVAYPRTARTTALTLWKNATPKGVFRTTRANTNWRARPHPTTRHEIERRSLDRSQAAPMITTTPTNACAR